MPKQDDVRQIALVNKVELYVFRYHLGEESTMIDCLMKKAADPHCPLDWFDAAVISHKMGAERVKEMQDKLKSFINGAKK